MRDANGLAPHGKVVEEGETEPVQMLQPVGYRCVGNEADSPTHADGSAVASPRCPRECANPLVCMSLEYPGPSPDSLPTLASCIARGTDLVQSAVCGWEIRCTGEGSLAGGLSRAINIEHEPMGSSSIPQPSCFLLLLQRRCEQVFEKHRSQRLDGSLRKLGKKAAQRRTNGQAVSSEQRHERVGKRKHSLVECLQRTFSVSSRNPEARPRSQ